MSQIAFGDNWYTDDGGASHRDAENDEAQRRLEDAARVRQTEQDMGPDTGTEEVRDGTCSDQ